MAAAQVIPKPLPTPPHLFSNYLKDLAKSDVDKSRADIAQRTARYLERGWDYGEGKKTVAKVGVGTTIGLGVAAVGVATHGAAVPVIAAIAVGGFAMGKMSDVGFAKLWGRQYTGGQQSRTWGMDNETASFADGFSEAKLLEERAHKTIRRSIQHYEAAKKKREAFPFSVAAPKSCSEAVSRALQLLHMKRHLDKAYVYLYPGQLLLRAMFEYEEAIWRELKSKDGQFGRKVWHTQDSECITCHYPKASPNGPNWNQGTFNGSDLANKLKALEIWSTLDCGPLTFDRKRMGPGVGKVFDMATEVYKSRGMAVKVKHGITNDLNRKTRSEKISLGTRTVISGGLAAAGGVAHAHFDEILGQVGQMLIDEAATFSDIGSGEVFENLEAGKSSQEGLRKVAIHLWEAQQSLAGLALADNKLMDFVGTTCDQALDYLRGIYTAQHHALKAQEYLDKTIRLVSKTKADLDTLSASIDALAKTYSHEIAQFLSHHPTSACVPHCSKY